ncbi:MAG: bifunctional diaminohydroxyphosphoribosylaminopyrimidine deaminase/5-amino-6-(5-phosphoribosylamino)uracil reductase RibD [Cytophagales bacterium]
MEGAKVNTGTEHEFYMKRALQLAALGLGNVSPNPMVGCVIVHEYKVIGEGFHRNYGEYHAEPNAIHAVQDVNLLSKSTLYVNLEPCSHFGKTPPCADLIIEKKIHKVVIANLDPNPLVAGKGIQKLRNAGIEVEIGILEKEGNWLNRRFFTFHKEKRPYIILKWAQTSDRFLARENFDSKWITNQYARQLVHKWRSEEAAILVGFNTALHDNPQLNVRQMAGKNPVRVLIDKHLQIPNTHHLLDQSQKNIVFNLLKNEVESTTESIQLDDFENMQPLLFSLFQRKIQSLIIEGGSKTLQKFIDQGLWDEARIFTSNSTFEKGIKAPILDGRLISREDILGDQLEIKIK